MPSHRIGQPVTPAQAGIQLEASLNVIPAEAGIQAEASLNVIPAEAGIQLEASLNVTPAQAGIQLEASLNVIPAEAGIHSSAEANMQPAVYILASKRNGTLYVGVTSDLVKRVWEHRNDVIEGFTKRNRVHDLAYYELHNDMLNAIMREKQIKKWNRAWKIELIEKSNPAWTDLWPTII